MNTDTKSSNGSRPIHHLAAESIEGILEWARNHFLSERERVGAANEPKLAVLSERQSFLLEKRQRLLEEIRSLQGARPSNLMAQLGYLTVALVLASVGYASARITVQPFNLGPAAFWLCLGLSVVVLFLGHEFLAELRKVWLYRTVLVFALLSGLAAILLLSEVRADVLAHYLSSGLVIVSGSGGEGDPSVSGGDEQQVFAVLNRAMRFATLAFEIGAALSFFRFTEARRNNDFARLNRLINKELPEVENKLLEVTEQIHQLVAEPSRQDAEFRQQFHKDVMERINRTWTGGALGVALAVALLSAATLQASDNLQVVAALDLSQTSAADYSGRSELEQNRQAIAAVLSRLPVGSGITVIGITGESYVNPQILISAELTDDPGYFNSRLIAGRRQLLAQWQKRSEGLAASYKATDILGALRYGGEVLTHGQAKRKVLAVFSDGRNCTAELDLERPQVIRVGPALNQLRQQGLLNSLEGVEVFLFGVGDHSGKRSTNYTLSLRDFWAAYIKEAGGRLVSFSTAREPHGLQLITTVGTAGRTSP